MIESVQISHEVEVDANPGPGRFLLTGSANVLLLPQLSEFLTGRIEIITLWPLSQGEIEGKNFVRGVVLYMGDAVLPFGSRFSAMPISALWAA